MQQGLRVVAVTTLLLIAALPFAVTAQSATTDGATVTSVETVIVKSPKNAAMMPYDGVYELRLT